MSSQTRPVAAKPTPELARQAASAEPVVPPLVVPLRQAFSVERAAGGWVFVTVNYRDDGTVVSVDRSQPDVKPIIIERFKISALKYWTSQ